MIDGKFADTKKVIRSQGVGQTVKWRKEKKRTNNGLQNTTQKTLHRKHYTENTTQKTLHRKHYTENTTQKTQQRKHYTKKITLRSVFCVMFSM
jgi:hypothetical protein